jgi:riboflavin synthase
MFTGLVEEAGAVASFAQRGDGAGSLVIRGGLILEGLRLGDSVAVNGCCLTVTAIEGDHLRFDLLGETLARTNLGAAKPGDRVNLERPLRAGAPLGGHFVQGHIDDTAPVLALEPRGEDRRLEIGLAREHARFVAVKGSVALNGVSLTVAGVGPDRFWVWLIPHTLAVTNLGELAAGDRVNVEFDILAKYLDRAREVGA